jgi:nitrile hydratase subunit beta
MAPAAGDDETEPRFSVGEWVRVLEVEPTGNPRTPNYVRGQVGQVTASHGVVDNPLDHRDPYPPLYTVVFEAGKVFDRRSTDLVSVDLHEEWLERAAPAWHQEG